MEMPTRWQGNRWALWLPQLPMTRRVPPYRAEGTYEETADFPVGRDQSNHSLQNRLTREEGRTETGVGGSAEGLPLELMGILCLCVKKLHKVKERTTWSIRGSISLETMPVPISQTLKTSWFRRQLTIHRKFCLISGKWLAWTWALLWSHLTNLKSKMWTGASAGA